MTTARWRTFEPSILGACLWVIGAALLLIPLALGGLAERLLGRR